MDNNQIKILQINIGEKFGGVSSMVYNLYQNVDRNKIQFDFVAPTKTSFELYRNEIENMGGKIIELNSKGKFVKRKLQFFYRYYKLLKNNNYAIVHCNSGSIFFNLQVAYISKICKIQKIIVHSHNAGNDNKIKITIGKMFKWIFPYVATDYFSCSKKAADFMFPKTIIQNNQYTIINNGVDTDKFEFNKIKRDEIRQNLGIEHKSVVLHIGRFTKQKNHLQLIDIFNEYQKKIDNAILILVGDGELKQAIVNKVNEFELQKKVLFLGIRKDIADLMSAADIFVLPSLYEGLPVVGVEAQANGLKCCFSSEITQEINLLNTGNVFIKLSDDATYWANAMIDLLQMNVDINRKSSASIISNKGYSLKAVGKTIQELYLE